MSEREGSNNNNTGENEQQVDEQQVPEQPAQSETEGWNKDVGETGRWGSRTAKEVWIVICLIVIMLVATIVGVILGTKDDGVEQEGETKIDPETGNRISAYVLPKPPTPTTITNDEELNILLTTLRTDPNVASYANEIPASTSLLNGLLDDETASPYVRAASWLTTVDTMNVKEYVVDRYALAVIYYNNGGVNWTNKDKWLSVDNHCDWYGITCCRDFLVSTLCNYTNYYSISEVDLFKNNLIGDIPHSISLLTELQSLFMSENNLVGTIPGAVFGSLKTFQKLYLQYNMLDGVVPDDMDGGVLDTLFIQNNNITGTFPRELCPPCVDCTGKLLHFGLDCHKIECSATCCRPWENCFINNKEYPDEVTV